MLLNIIIKCFDKINHIVVNNFSWQLNTFNPEFHHKLLHYKSIASVSVFMWLFVTVNHSEREWLQGMCFFEFVYTSFFLLQMCSKHGTDFLEYKCRYCCSVAVFFCFGTTHFCNACHDDFQRMTSVPKEELPHCPAGTTLKCLNKTQTRLLLK